MATRPQIAMAISVIRSLEIPQTQVSLHDQAKECAAIVQAAGYYDLADYLKRMGRS